MASTLSTQCEATLDELLTGIVTQVGGAIEFWTLVCLSPHELGDPVSFVDQQWMSLREQIQELRACLSAEECGPSDAVLEQVAKLSRVCAELREVFDFFINAATVSRIDLEAAVMRLAQLWQDIRMRVWLLGALVPLPEPLLLPLEKEAYYQMILDGLFDQFSAALTSSNGELHGRNGKVSH